MASKKRLRDSDDDDPQKKKLCVVSEKGFLHNHLIHLHKAGLSKTRRGIFEKQIVQHSGTLVQDLDDFSKYSSSPFSLVLVEDELIDSEKLPGIVDKCLATLSTKVTFLALRWLSACLKENSKVDHEAFVIKHTVVKQTKKKSEGDQGENRPFTLKFVCAHSSADPQSKAQNHNSRITDELSKLASAYKSTNDQWRAFGYEKAIAALKRYPTEITCRDEAAKIPGVGGKMADKIMEILESGSLQKVSEVCGSERVQTVELFTRVWGAGPATAESWYQQGFRTLQDLSDKASLTKQQKVGLRHFQNLDERMERSEAAEIEAFVHKEAGNLREGLEVIACGSYRRGKQTCGDLDVLITHPNDACLTGLFDELIKRLETLEFLTDHLSFHRDGNQRKYLGVCKLPGQSSKHRRLDIIVVPYGEKATSLLYFTGSAHFNRSMRLLAVKKGMSLSEHALTKDVVRSHKEKLNQGTKLNTPTEQSVFEALGLPYREPHERDH